MRRTFLCAAAILIASAGTPVSARGQFTAYVGDSSIHQGTGGTNVSRDGVDFWTNGTPSRRFEIIGTLTDTRSGQLAAERAIGSSSLARTARALGGDGLILYDRRKRDGGYVGLWTGGDTISLAGARASSTTMSFVVVRYLD